MFIRIYKELPMNTPPCKGPAVPGNIFSPGWTSNFSEIKDQLKTGDIILVHGRYPFSWVVEFLQGSDYGHSAIVVRRSDLDPSNKFNLPAELLLWESNIEIPGSTPNLWRPSVPPKVKDGPMLISLEERLLYSQCHYEDVYIAVRPLFINRANIKFDNILPSFFDSLIDKKFPSESEIIHSVFLGRKYNRDSNNPLEAVSLNIADDIVNNKKIVLEDPSKNQLEAFTLKADTKSKDKIYCSELVAATYKELGILTQNHVSNAYAPGDFSDKGTIRLLKSGWLGSEMFIDMRK